MRCVGARKRVADDDELRPIVHSTLSRVRGSPCRLRLNRRGRRPDFRQAPGAPTGRSVGCGRGRTHGARLREFRGRCQHQLLCLPTRPPQPASTHPRELLHWRRCRRRRRATRTGPAAGRSSFQRQHDEFLTAAAFEQTFAAAAHLGALRQLVTVEAGLREADASDERTVLTALVQRRRALLRALKLAKLGALVGPPARFLRQQLELLRMAHVLLADAVVEATIALLAGRYDELRAAPGFDSLQRILPPLIYLRLLRAVPPTALDAAARGEPPRPWPRLADDRVVTGSFAALLPPLRRGRASAEEEEVCPGSFGAARARRGRPRGGWRRAYERRPALNGAVDRGWRLSPSAKEMQAALDASLAAAQQ